MPYLVPEDEGEQIYLRSPLGGPVELPPVPDLHETIAAGFRAQNSVVNVVRMLRQGYDEPVKDYNPFDDIKGTPYEEYGSRFTFSESPGETSKIKARIEQELADKRTLAAAGVLGTASQMLAGTLDPTLAIPGGTIYRGVRGLGALKSAASLAAAGGAASALQEGVLQTTQATRTPQESWANISAATILSSVVPQEGFREPWGLMPELRDIEAAQGREAAVARSKAHAESLQDDIAALVRKHNAPLDLTYGPCVGFCLDDERLNEGAVVACDPAGIVWPNHVAVFDHDGLLAVKVYLGISTDERFAKAMKLEGKQPLAVFWMANPESLIAFPLASLTFLAPVVGTLSERGYEPLGGWQFTDEQMQLVELAMRCTVRQPLLSFAVTGKAAGEPLQPDWGPLCPSNPQD